MTVPAHLRAKLRAMPAAELAELRERMGKRHTHEAAVIHLAAFDEETRRENAAKLEPIGVGVRRGTASRLFVVSHDPDVLEAVRAERARRKAEADRLFDTTAHVKLANDGK